MDDAFAAFALADGAGAALLVAISAAAVAAAIAASTDVPARVWADTDGVVVGKGIGVAPTALDDVVWPVSLDMLALEGARGRVGSAELGAAIAGAAGPGDTENGVLVAACGATARAAALADPCFGAASACDAAGADAADDGTCAVAAADTAGAPKLLACAGRPDAVAGAGAGGVEGGATAVAAGEWAPDASMGREAAPAG